MSITTLVIPNSTGFTGNTLKNTAVYGTFSNFIYSGSTGFSYFQGDILCRGNINNTYIGQGGNILTYIPGLENLAVGTNALANNIPTTGQGRLNTSIGPYTLTNNIGSYNTANGSYALNNNTGGNYNSAIGYNAYNTGSYSYSTAIGYNSQPTGSNQIVLGTSAETTYIPGILSTSNINLVGTTYTFSSGSVSLTKNTGTTNILPLPSSSNPIGYPVGFPVFPTGATSGTWVAYITFILQALGPVSGYTVSIIPSYSPTSYNDGINTPITSIITSTVTSNQIVYYFPMINTNQLTPGNYCPFASLNLQLITSTPNQAIYFNYEISVSIPMAYSVIIKYVRLT